MDIELNPTQSGELYARAVASGIFASAKSVKKNSVYRHEDAYGARFYIAFRNGLGLKHDDYQFCDYIKDHLIKDYKEKNSIVEIKDGEPFPTICIKNIGSETAAKIASLETLGVCSFPYEPPSVPATVSSTPEPS